MVFQNMINMQLMMFMLVIIGFLVRKKGIVKTEGRKNLVDLCMYITLPFNIFHAFMMSFEWGMLRACALIIGLSLLYSLVAVLLSFLLYRKETLSRRQPLRYGTIVSNGGFLGNPVIEGIYGSNGLFYASMFMLPFRIVMWTVGISCFIKNEKPVNVIKKVATHPCLVAIYLGLIYMISDIGCPVFLEKTIAGLSNCNTPLSMMLIGMMLAEMNPRGLIDKQLMFYTSVRLIIIPAILFAITASFAVEPMLRGITVILAGMPTPVTAVLMSAKYGADEKYATAMIFVTTILSLITLPLWCLLLGS